MPAKLTFNEETRLKIYSMGSAGKTISEISKALNVSQAYVSKLCKQHQIFGSRDEYGLRRKRLLEQAIEHFSVHVTVWTGNQAKQYQNCTPAQLRELANHIEAIAASTATALETQAVGQPLI